MSQSDSDILSAFANQLMGQSGPTKAPSPPKADSRPKFIPKSYDDRSKALTLRSEPVVNKKENVPVPAKFATSSPEIPIVVEISPIKVSAGPLLKGDAAALQLAREFQQSVGKGKGRHDHVPQTYTKSPACTPSVSPKKGQQVTSHQSQPGVAAWTEFGKNLNAQSPAQSSYWGTLNTVFLKASSNPGDKVKGSLKTPDQNSSMEQAIKGNDTVIPNHDQKTSQQKDPKEQRTKGNSMGGKIGTDQPSKGLAPKKKNRPNRKRRKAKKSKLTEHQAVPIEKKQVVQNIGPRSTGSVLPIKTIAASHVGPAADDKVPKTVKELYNKFLTAMNDINLHNARQQSIMAGIQKELVELNRRTTELAEADERRRLLGTSTEADLFNIIVLYGNLSVPVQVTAQLTIGEVIRRFRKEANLSPEVTQGPRMSFNGKERGHLQYVTECGIKKGSVVMFHCDGDVAK